MINQAMLDSLPFGVMVTDKSLHLTAINRWITHQVPITVPDCHGVLITDLFPDIKERGLHSIYELVVESEQRITISNRIHKYLLKMAAQPASGLDHMPQSTIVAPLFVNDELAGTVTVISDVSERVITERILNREIDKLSTLHNVDQALAVLDLQACMNVIVIQTQAHFKAEGIAVFLLEDNELKQAAGVGLVDVHTPTANSLASWCYNHRKPRLTTHAKNSSMFAPLIPNAQTELAAPLVIGDVCIGVIQVCIGQERQSDKYDLELLEGLAVRAATAFQNARLHEESQHWRKYHERVNNRLQTLLTAVRLMSKTNDLMQTLDSVTEMMVGVFHASFVVILRPDGISNRLLPVSLWGDKRMAEHSHAADQALTQLAFPPGAKSKSYSNLQQVSYLSEDYQSALLASGMEQLMSVGLSVRESFAGIVHVFSTNTRPGFNEEEQELFEAMAAQLNLAIENAELYAQQQKLAVTDGLTGVFNRRRFDQELEIWMKRTHRSNSPTSLIMLDIDNFKHFNDTFGHQTGDDVLKLLANIITRCMREVDIIARYGGEEFVVILPDTALDEAILAAERLRLAVMNLLKMAENPLAREETLTISLGIACAPYHAHEARALLKTADQFLYDAKHAGKNRWVTSQMG